MEMKMNKNEGNTSRGLTEDLYGYITTGENPPMFSRYESYTPGLVNNDRIDKEMVIGDKIEIRRVTAKCPKCGGELEYTGEVYCVNPPKYEHRCKKCGYITDLWNEYPNYIAIDADTENNS